MVDTNKNLLINEGGLLSMTFPLNHFLIVNDPLMFMPSSTNENNQNIMPDFYVPQIRAESSLNNDFPVWELLCDDQVKFSDEDGFSGVKNFVLTGENAANVQTTVFEIEDDDDDVIFVGEYQLKKEKNVKKPLENQPRRNPVRQARNSKMMKHADEIIYEDDFRMLDSSEDDSEIVSNSLPITKPTEPKIKNISLKDIKKWPTSGLHERPEYNTETKKIEKFDYTIREIQSKVTPVKKAPLNAKKNQKLVRKPKKYTVKRRRKAKTVAVEKVQYSDLKDLIEKNLELVGNFIKNVSSSFRQKTHRCLSLEEEKENLNSEDKHAKCMNNFNELLMNQCHFYSYLNNVSAEQIYAEKSEKS